MCTVIVKNHKLSYSTQDFTEVRWRGYIGRWGEFAPKMENPCMQSDEMLHLREGRDTDDQLLYWRFRIITEITKYSAARIIIVTFLLSHDPALQCDRRHRRIVVACIPSSSKDCSSYLSDAVDKPSAVALVHCTDVYSDSSPFRTCNYRPI